MNEEEWFAYLEKLTDKLNSYEDCRDRIKNVGQANVQYRIMDQESYSFAQEYDGTRIILIRGTVSNPTLTHSTTLEVMRGVLAGTTNPIIATMRGKYKVEGNLTKLMKFQGLLPYLKKAHSEIT